MSSKRSSVKAVYKTRMAAITGIQKVYVGRRLDIPQQYLPAICIYCREEGKELDTIGPAKYARGLAIVTEIHVKADSVELAELELDALCDLREAALLTDETLGGKVEAITFQSDEYALSESGNIPTAVATCADIVHYTH